MPKASRKKQTRAARQQAAEGPAGSRNDIANPSNGPKERAAASVPILKKLENPETSADDKRWACAGLANLVADMDANQRRMLQSQKIVDTLIRLVQEADILVQAEAVGALRNLAVAGGSEICAEMVNKGLVAGLTGHFEAISSRVTGSIEYSEDGHTHGMLWDWAENLSVLIWSLAEGAPKCLPSLNKIHALPPFLLLLAHSYATQDFNPPPPVTLALSALHALTVLSSENPEFSLPMLNLDLEPLLSLLRGTATHKKAPSKSPRIENQRYLSRVLALSVLLNLLASRSASHKKKEKLMLDDLKSQVNPLSLPVLLEGLVVFRGKLDTADEDDLEDALVLLECLSEVCSTLDGLHDEQDEWRGIVDEDQPENGEAMDEDAPEEPHGGEDGIDDSMMEDMQRVAGSGNNDPALPESTSKLVQQYDLPSNLLALALKDASASASAEGIIPTAQTDVLSLDSLTQARLMVRQRALEALNNFLFTLARQHATTIVPPPLLQHLWTNLLQLSVSLVSSPNDALKCSVGCLWALASLSFGADEQGDKSSEPLFEVQEQETAALLQMLQSSATGMNDLIAEIQSRVAGALAVLGSRENVPLAENEAIGTALATPFATLDASEQPSNATLSLLAQVMDSFIDLYSDETKPTEKVFRSKDFLDVLKAALPKVQIITKKVDKRKMPELRMRLDANLVNLKAFVQYRENLK